MNRNEIGTMSVFAVVDAEGREAGLFLITAIEGGFREKLYLVHLVNTKMHSAGTENRPLFPPLALKEALQTAKDYAVHNAWQKKVDQLALMRAESLLA